MYGSFFFVLRLFLVLECFSGDEKAGLNLCFLGGRGKRSGGHSTRLWGEVWREAPAHTPGRALASGGEACVEPRESRPT